MEIQYAYYICKGYLREFQAVRVGFVVYKGARGQDVSLRITYIPSGLYTLQCLLITSTRTSNAWEPSNKAVFFGVLVGGLDRT
jgi:hypothetical protein